MSSGAEDVDDDDDGGGGLLDAAEVFVVAADFVLLAVGFVMDLVVNVGVGVVVVAVELIPFGDAAPEFGDAILS